MTEGIQPIGYGKIVTVAGSLMEASGLTVPVGTICRIGGSRADSIAKVVGFSGKKTQLAAIRKCLFLRPGDRVYPGEGVSSTLALPSVSRVVGRVVDPLGEPLDGRGLIPGSTFAKMETSHSNPLAKRPIDTLFDVGVRAINTCMPIGLGQRVGIFAGSGVGKSTLLSMMARHSEAEAVVVALVGERGREVREFIERGMGSSLSTSVVVAAPADYPPLLKMQGAEYACSLAEELRSQGKHCLLIMDSLTRYAMAAREVGLATGEPPATKGYPPSVFAKINELVERAGNGSESEGSITAFFTILSEGDDMMDPVADSARAILDGHITLSRRLADSGHYPPIEIGASVSRVFPWILDKKRASDALLLRGLVSAAERSSELVAIGAYAKGSDPLLDEAISKKAAIDAFLRQPPDEKSSFATSFESLARIIGKP